MLQLKCGLLHIVCLLLGYCILERNRASRVLLLTLILRARSWVTCLSDLIFSEFPGDYLALYTMKFQCSSSVVIQTPVHSKWINDSNTQ